MKRFLLLLPLVLFNACSSGKATPERKVDASTAALRFYPLKVGNRWHYSETAMGKEDRHWRTTVTEQPTPDTFVLSIEPTDAQGNPTGPAARQKLEARPRGIFDGVRYQLEEPVVLGHKWMAVVDVRTAEKFEVTSVTTTARVPAGDLENCALVVNAIRDTGDVMQRTEATFCPDVGMAETRIRITKPGKPDIDVSHLRLRAFETGGNRVLPRMLGE